jgi:hypothetical protein
LYPFGLFCSLKKSLKTKGGIKGGFRQLTPNLWFGVQAKNVSYISKLKVSLADVMDTLKKGNLKQSKQSVSFYSFFCALKRLFLHPFLMKAT